MGWGQGCVMGSAGIAQGDALKAGKELCVPTVLVTIGITCNGQCCFDIARASDAWLLSKTTSLSGMWSGAAVPNENTGLANDAWAAPWRFAKRSELQKTLQAQA